MIVRQREVDPLHLMIAPGGSIAAAQSITGALLQSATNAFADLLDTPPQPPPGRYEVHASWVAIVADGEGVDTVEWDPTTPIPTGAVRLRCTAYTAPCASEDAG